MKPFVALLFCCFFDRIRKRKDATLEVKGTLQHRQIHEKHHKTINIYDIKIKISLLKTELKIIQDSKVLFLIFVSI
jgi:hypothetical protein